MHCHLPASGLPQTTRELTHYVHSSTPIRKEYRSMGTRHQGSKTLSVEANTVATAIDDLQGEAGGLYRSYSGYHASGDGLCQSTSNTRSAKRSRKLWKIGYTGANGQSTLRSYGS